MVRWEEWLPMLQQRQLQDDLPWVRARGLYRYCDVAEALCTWLEHASANLSGGVATAAAAALAVGNARELARASWERATRLPAYAYSGVPDAAHAAFVGAVGELIPLVVLMDCDGALNALGAYVAVTSGPEMTAQLLGMLHERDRWNYLRQPRVPWTRWFETPSSRVDDGRLLEFMLARASARDTKGMLACVALRSQLPRLYGVMPAETLARCSAYLLQGKTRYRPIYVAITSAVPALLTLHGEDTPTERDARKLHRRYAGCCEARGVHPHVLASAMYLGVACLHGAVCNAHDCGSSCCAWWGAVCDHVALLCARTPASWKAPTAAAPRDDIVQHLIATNQFSACVKLAACGFIEPHRLVCRQALDVDSAETYSAADIAAALRPQREGGPCDAPREGPQRARSFVAGLYWLSLGRATRSVTPHDRLPEWTPKTHRALYSYCEELHDAVRVLLLLYERECTSLAALPREMLFHVFHCMTLMLCARPE